MGNVPKKRRVLTRLLPVAYVVLWGCTPTTILPPHVPSASGLERGVAVNALAFDEDPSRGDWTNPRQYRIGGGVSSWLLSAGEESDSAWVIHGGFPNVMGVGRSYRKHIAKTDRVYLGLSASAGLFWLNGGLPMALALKDGVWLYSQPTIAPIPVQEVLAFHIPIGLAHETRAGNRIFHELGFRQQPNLKYNPSPGDPALNTFYYSLGIGQPR